MKLKLEKKIIYLSEYQRDDTSQSGNQNVSDEVKRIKFS